MPKNVWATKKRKKHRKKKSSDLEPDAEFIERSRMPDPNEPSISIGMISDLSLSIPVKTEKKVIYPDTRFQCSTTLFPAKSVEEKCLTSQTPRGNFKRSAEDELICTIFKKRKRNDLSKTKSIISDDCMIIENSKTRVKVEVIDLTEDSHPIIPILCSPVKTNYENRLPGKQNTTVQDNSDIHVKTEPSENISEINVDGVGSSDVNGCTAQANTEQNKVSERNNEVNVEFNENVDHSLGEFSRIQIKTEKRVPPKENNYDEFSAKDTGNRIQIKTEKVSRGNNTDANSENSHTTVSKDADLTSRNIYLKSELDNRNGDTTDINVTIKVEQNKNCVVGENSTSLLNFSSDANVTGIDSVDRSIKSEQNKAIENCKKDFQNSYDYEKLQNNEVVSQKISNCNENIDAVSSETSIRSDLKRMNIYPVADKGIFSCDTQLFKPGTFQTPILKYLNCNTKVLEILHALSALNNFIKIEEKINVIESEVIPNYIDSQGNSKLCLVEKKDLQINEEKSLKVDEILHENSLPNITELVNLKQNSTNLDSNSASSHLVKYINKRQVQILSNSDVLGDEMRLHNTSNMLFESQSKMHESSPASNSDSPKTSFNSPIDIENPSEDKCSLISLPSLNNNEQSETSCNFPMEEETSYNESLSNDLLRQILNNVSQTDKSDVDNSWTFTPSVDSIAKTSNLRQIKLPKNQMVENLNFATDVNERSSASTIKTSENFSNRFSESPENVLKRSHSVTFNPIICGDTFETPPKSMKIHEKDSISKSSRVKKLGNAECKRDNLKTSCPHYPSDHLLNNHLVSDFSLKSTDSFSGASNFDQNIFTPSANRQSSSPSVCSETSMRNHGYRHLVNTTSPRDPRLVRNYSPGLQRYMNPRKPLGSINISQSCVFPLQSSSEVSKLSVCSLVNQISPGSTIPSMPNFSKVILSPAELFRFTVNSDPIQQVNPVLSQNDTFKSPYLNQQISVKNSHVSLPTSETISFSKAYNDNLQQSIEDVRNQEPFLSRPHLLDNTSTSSQYNHLESKEIPPPISRHNTPSYDKYFTEIVNFGYGLNSPLPIGNPPSPSFPSTPPILEQSHSIVSNISSGSLLHDNKKLSATKNLTIHNQSSSNFFASKPSLLPKNLIRDIAKNLINTNDVYLIIIERNIDWIHGIDKEIRVPRMSEIGCEFQQVKNSYKDHLMYYNTYFPLFLLECFSKISSALKATKQKGKKDRNICRVVKSETKQNYVCFTCDSFIHHSDVDDIPKDGQIILVKFAAIPEGNVKMLGYVYSSATRAYSHRHDHGNEILEYVNVNKRTDLIKIRIKFYIVFEISNINLDAPIHVLKLTSIKKALMLNDALKELQRSPLCDAILGLRNRNIKKFALPRRQDINVMFTVIQEIVQSLNPSSSQLTIVESAPFSDSFLAIVQIVEEIRKLKIPGKILVCVRSKMLCEMGMNLMETSSNVIIINRERESLHEKLNSRVLDIRISHVSKAQNILPDKAKKKVLQEAEVLLAVTGICFYEDVRRLARDLAYCIIHDAHSFPEPESLLPLMYGIRHLLLVGDPDELCVVNSKCGASLGYNKSLFHRIHNLC